MVSYQPEVEKTTAEIVAAIGNHMTDTPPTIKPDDALFVQDRELHRRINPQLGWDRFRAALRNAELQGFPKVHRTWGGRYVPAVKAWFDKHVGSGASSAVAEDVEDGPEDFGR